MDGNKQARTICIHGGEEPARPGAPVREALVMSSMYHLPKEETSVPWSDPQPGVYARNGSDNQLLLERRLAQLEGAQDAMVLSSGVAALSAVFWTYLPAGSHVICSAVCYAAVRKLFGGLLHSRYGIESTLVDTTDVEQVRRALRPETRLIHVETPGNPTTGISDIAALARLAHEAGALLSVDGTFASPLYQRPLELGADFSIHSMTKYINGHGDAMGGCVLGSQERIARMKREAMINQGGVISPFNAWLITRGLMTLPLRMRVHSENALTVARFLQGHPAVSFVRYPGLEDHPQYQLALEQMEGMSGMLCFGLRQSRPGAHIRFLRQLCLIAHALSLGDAGSLVVWTDGEQARQYGYPPAFHGGYFRMSVGLEDTADLIDDLSCALDAI